MPSRRTLGSTFQLLLPLARAMSPSGQSSWWQHQLRPRRQRRTSDCGSESFLLLSPGNHPGWSRQRLLRGWRPLEPDSQHHLSARLPCLFLQHQHLSQQSNHRLRNPRALFARQHRSPGDLRRWKPRCPARHNPRLQLQWRCLDTRSGRSLRVVVSSDRAQPQPRPPRRQLLPLLHPHLRRQSLSLRLCHCRAFARALHMWQWRDLGASPKHPHLRSTYGIALLILVDIGHWCLDFRMPGVLGGE